MCIEEMRAEELYTERRGRKSERRQFRGNRGEMTAKGEAMRHFIDFRIVD